MSQRTRTPRQKQGNDLRPLLVRLPPELYARIAEHATAEDRSLADVVRLALVEYFEGKEEG